MTSFADPLSAEAPDVEVFHRPKDAAERVWDAHRAIWARRDAHTA